MKWQSFNISNDAGRVKGLGTVGFMISYTLITSAQTHCFPKRLADCFEREGALARHGADYNCGSRLETPSRLSPLPHERTKVRAGFPQP